MAGWLETLILMKTQSSNLDLDIDLGFVNMTEEEVDIMDENVSVRFEVTLVNISRFEVTFDNVGGSGASRA